MTDIAAHETVDRGLVAINERIESAAVALLGDSGDLFIAFHSRELHGFEAPSE